MLRSLARAPLSRPLKESHLCKGAFKGAPPLGKGSYFLAFVRKSPTQRSILLMLCSLARAPLSRPLKESHLCKRAFKGAPLLSKGSSFLAFVRKSPTQRSIYWCPALRQGLLFLSLCKKVIYSKEHLKGPRSWASAPLS
jgi:hypothetical protein